MQFSTHTNPRRPTNLNEAFGKASNVPKLDRAVPVVLAGGTARPKGFREKFETALKESKCPIEVSEVRLSPRPMQATAAGALVAAVNDS